MKQDHFFRLGWIGLTAGLKKLIESRLTNSIESTAFYNGVAVRALEQKLGL